MGDPKVQEVPNAGPNFWMIKDELPGNDFNRHIIEAGSDERLPEGAVAIYVDDDFWCVGILPLDRYRNMPVAEIVAELWPHYVPDAIYAPDHGTTEQEIYQLKGALESEQKKHDWVWKEFTKLQEENKLLARGRTSPLVRNRSRHENSVSYFVRQYEHLLVAFAHEAVPRTDLPGVCSICNLLGSDRVHMKHWIERHNSGYDAASMVMTMVDDEDQD